ncbi:MAG: hypothetical protein ACK5U8_17530 [Deltaproteobacteria bacterium]
MPRSTSDSTTTFENTSGACRMGTSGLASAWCEVRIFTPGPIPTLVPISIPPAAWRKHCCPIQLPSPIRSSFTW